MRDDLFIGKSRVRISPVAIAKKQKNNNNNKILEPNCDRLILHILKRMGDFESSDFSSLLLLYSYKKLTPVKNKLY